MLPEHAAPTGGAPNAAPNAPIVRGFGFDNNLPARFQQVLGRPIPIGGGGAPAPPPPPPAAAEAAEVGAPGAPQVLLERPGVRLMQGPPRFGRLGGGAARRAARAQAPLYQEQPNYRDLVELAAEQARQAAAAPPPQLVPMLRDPIPIRFHRRDELLDRFGMDLGVAHRQELPNERIELAEARDQLAEQQRRALEAQRDQLARHNALADDLRARRERIVQEARAHARRADARDARLEAAAAADRRERFLQEAQEADARRAADGDARAELGEQLRALEAAVAGLPEAQAPQLRDRRARFVARLRARRAADAQAGALANEQRALEARLEGDFADLRAAEGRLLHPPPPQNPEVVVIPPKRARRGN
ncbi:UBIQUITIN_CONJUGAT_2 domain-containing protein [Caenorhabditis elegans]|nr:UBIQUITIN_CONJUGAT_2 domain-containing protein [Caenorhabditis elegans]SKC30510.1 UBIQUITIN_CONJUGAT_2 domain-containing protein [Caenorhabditis elegans]|eukprot:NP_001337302.1 UBiquitin Conjugating enzyme [Caenorhabditis elegans]